MQREVRDEVMRFLQADAALEIAEIATRERIWRKFTRESGVRVAQLKIMARTLEDLIAYQFAEEFKLEVYALVKASPGARKDFDFTDQLRRAAAGVASTTSEGFGRGKAGEFAQFLRYSLASLREAVTHVKDGIDRGHFIEPDCRAALVWAQRCRRATLNLYHTQCALAAKDRALKRKGRPRRLGRRTS
jgi:four helix bundle protein